ncbi:MAG: signal peptidase II, partial [Bdellovibrionota bacterium]
MLFVTVGCDQATKHIARDMLSNQQTFSYLGDMIRFQHAENPGAFLSFGAALSGPVRFSIFTGLVIAFLIWAGIKLFRDRASMNAAATFGWTLVLAGGLGN